MDLKFSEFREFRKSQKHGCRLIQRSYLLPVPWRCCGSIWSLTQEAARLSHHMYKRFVTEFDKAFRENWNMVHIPVTVSINEPRIPCAHRIRLGTRPTTRKRTLWWRCWSREPDHCTSVTLWPPHSNAQTLRLPPTIHYFCHYGISRVTAKLKD